VELQRRDCRAIGLYPPVGRETRRSDSATYRLVKHPMMILDRELARREDAGNPIRIGIVGAGFMGQGMALQLCTPLTGMRLVAIANRRVERAGEAWVRAGYESTVAKTQKELDDAIAS